MTDDGGKKTLKKEDYLILGGREMKIKHVVKSLAWFI